MGEPLGAAQDRLSPGSGWHSQGRPGVWPQGKGDTARVGHRAHRAPGLPQGTTLSWSCPQTQPGPCPGQPCCVLVPPSGPAQPRQGTRGQGTCPWSLLLSVWMWRLDLPLHQPSGWPFPHCPHHQGPSLTVPVTRAVPSVSGWFPDCPCHQDPQPGPGHAGSGQSRVSTAGASRGSLPAPGRRCGVSPVPRPRSTQVPAARAESSPAPAQRELLGTGSPAGWERGSEQGGRRAAGRVTPGAARSGPGPPSARAKVGGGRKTN